MLEVSEDGRTDDIQPFSLSRQMLLGSVMKGIPCSTLHHFKEDPSQAAARIVREATEDKYSGTWVQSWVQLEAPFQPKMARKLRQINESLIGYESDAGSWEYG